MRIHKQELTCADVSWIPSYPSRKKGRIAMCPSVPESLETQWTL